jgi:hypothetical protein
MKNCPVYASTVRVSNHKKVPESCVVHFPPSGSIIDIVPYLFRKPPREYESKSGKHEEKQVNHVPRKEIVLDRERK